MATIKISNLHPIGSELFLDEESFMNELKSDEAVDVKGGFYILLIAAYTAMMYTLR
jgi:hypothetical protein